jgi:transcriptional regulator with XRE-family HTH domain
MRKNRTIFDVRPISQAVQSLTVPKPKGEVSKKSSQSTLLECLDWNAPEERPAFPMFSPWMRTEQSALVRTIGARMREARELCNMSQQSAAERLGYENSSKLAKIEHASDTNSVPLMVVFRAAQLYDVSVDFLFGLTDDWEPDCIRRESNSFLVRAWEEARRRDLDALGRLYRRVQAVATAIDELVSGSNEVAAALRSVRERGGEFDELPAGNRLLSAIERQTETARNAEGGLRRFRAELLGKMTPTE